MSPFQGWDYAGDTTQGLRPDGRYTLGYSVSPSGLGAGNPFSAFNRTISSTGLIHHPMELDISRLLLQFSLPAKRAKLQCRAPCPAFGGGRQ